MSDITDSYNMRHLRSKPDFSNEVFNQLEPIQKKNPLQVFDDAVVDRLFKGSGRHFFILRNIVGQL